MSSKLRKREKALFDLKRAEDGLENLQLKAPADGMVNVLPNYRAGSMMGASPEFRQGDRAWAGAAILELPDLSSVHLQARLDESDRSRLQVGQVASVRIEAVPGNDFKAKIDRISMLARPDYQSTWPPPRNFDLDLVLLDVDPRIRPGMTAVARIATERIAERRPHPLRGDFPARRGDGRLRARWLRVPRAPRPDPEARQRASDRRVGD